MEKKKEIPKSIEYLNRIEELIKLGSNINIFARFVHLKRIIYEDINNAQVCPECSELIDSITISFCECKNPQFTRTVNENYDLMCGKCGKQLK